MGGFMGWFLTFLLVLAIFNAEKLPALREKVEEKIKNSVDAAKEGSKLASNKIKQVKNDIENRKNAVGQVEAEENTQEEIAESLQFMGNYLKQEMADQNAQNTDAAAQETAAEPEKSEPDAEVADEDKPIDLENRY